MTRPLLFVGGAVRRWQGVGFAVFCLLAGSRWLVENAWPSALPPLLSQGFHFAVITLVALAFWWPQRRPLPDGWWRVGVAGLLLFGVPRIVVEWAGSQTGPALFTWVPLCVVVSIAAISTGEGNRHLMMPALVGAAGGLLVLPFALPACLSGAAKIGAVLAAVAVVAMGSVWLHALLREVGLAAGVLLVCGTNAGLLGAAGHGVKGQELFVGAWLGELARALVFDLPEVILLLWLLRVAKPEQVAARFFFVPLVTVLEGLVLLRPGLDLRTSLGIALMGAGGGAMLLWKNEGKEDAPVRLGLLG